MSKSLKFIMHMKILIFHRDGFFFRNSLSVDWYQKKILLLSHLTYPTFWGGILEKRRGMWGAQDGMEDDFFC